MRNIIVIGASAGGIDALMTIVGALPPDFPAAVFVVVHVGPNARSALPQILSRCGPLKATHAVEGEPIKHGTITIAPPDHHLMLGEGHVHVVHGPKENGFRPAVDPLFRSAAEAYGPRVVGVILTGSLDDGTAGLLAIKRKGGVAVVEDPEHALFADMPRSALRYVKVDYVRPLEAIAPLLMEIAATEVGAGEKSVMGQEKAKLELENDISAMDKEALQHGGELGVPTPFSCPDCGGVLTELYDGPLLRFRCQVGHAYSPESVEAGQSEAVERALWSAFRSLNERSTLAERLAREAKSRNDAMASRRFLTQIREIEDQKELVRDVLNKCTSRAGEGEPTSSPTGTDGK